MTSREFCYWLQGFFELDDGPPAELTAAQADIIKRHLNLVFKHDIDPSYPDSKILSEIHNGTDKKTSSVADYGHSHGLVRC